jgi:hypothetical protein
MPLKRILAATAFAIATMAASSAAVADNKLTAEASLCQRDVLSRIQVDHPKGKVDFNNKGVSSQPLTGSEVQVTGKGNFTKHDGTVKGFDYSCRVNTAEGRVVDASYKQTGKKD